MTLKSDLEAADASVRQAERELIEASERLSIARQEREEIAAELLAEETEP